MPDYSDPGKNYTLEYPEGWLPLTQEGTPHVSLASLNTGGYLKVEAYQFLRPTRELTRPEKTLRALIESEQRTWPDINDPDIKSGLRHDVSYASTVYTRVEPEGEEYVADFGHTRAWVFSRGKVQIRCLYRCRSEDAGVDDDDIEMILGSLEIQNDPCLDAVSFTSYYYTLLKRKRPRLASSPPEDLTLTLVDGQTVLLEHLYNHYLLEPDRRDDLIETHIQRLDYCGDDVPDLTNLKQIRRLLFPKIVRASSPVLPPHRLPFWPGLAIGAVIQGSVFTYGVNMERLKNWGAKSLDDIMDDLMENLYNVPPVAPRGLRDKDGNTEAISYVDHPFSASFTLFEYFYQTTAHNLSASEFLVGLPDPSCVSCFRDDNPRFVVQHTALLRRDFHRSIERLTDTIYLVTGPTLGDIKPYDILHCCPKKN